MEEVLVLTNFQFFLGGELFHFFENFRLTTFFKNITIDNNENISIDNTITDIGIGFWLVFIPFLFLLVTVEKMGWGESILFSSKKNIRLTSLVPHLKQRAERGCNKPHVSSHPFFF